MDKSRIFNLILIIIGGGIALYANVETTQTPFILILGIIFLMTGVYRVSRNIPSKFEDNETIQEPEDEL